MPRKRTIWAGLVCLPVAVIAIISIIHYSTRLVSPCVGWAGGNFPTSADVKSPCQSYSVDSRTRAEATLWMAGVSGVILLATGLAMWGTLRSRQAVVIVAGLLMLCEMIPLGLTLWPLALLAGAGLLVVAYRSPD